MSTTTRAAVIAAGAIALLFGCGDSSSGGAGPDAGDAGGGAGGADTGGGSGGSGGSGGDAGGAGGTSGGGGGSGGSSGSGGSGGSSGSGGSGGSSGSGGSGGTGGDAGPVPAGVSCDDADVADASMTLEGYIDDDTTLEGLIHVTDFVRSRSGSTVTIEPGTTFIMDVDTFIEFGWNNNDATVMAAGTEDLPIRFCAKDATSGYWGYVYFGASVTSDSVLEHVIISNAGMGGDAAALRLLAPVHVSNVRIEDSATTGVLADDFASDSENLSVVRAGGVAVALNEADAVDTLPLGGDFTDNADNVIELRYTRIQTDTTIKAAPIPYRQEGDVNVYDIELTIEAGVEYTFAADAFLDIGWNSNATSLQIEGESGSPVVFRGKNATKGYWRGIRVGQNTTSNSAISHIEIHDAGGLDTSAFVVHARITLDNITLEDNTNGALFDSPLQPASTMLTITGTEGVPLTVELPALTSIPTGGSFVGNDEDEIEINDSDATHVLTGTVPDLGVPYHLLEDISLQDGSDLTIAAGTEFIMGGDSQIQIGWNNNMARFIAVGTSTEPIVFIGEQDTAGYWPGIRVLQNATADTQFDYVYIVNAGRAGSAALDLDRAISVTNCTIDSSAGAGIEKMAADATNYEATNTFTDVAQGNVIDQ